LWGLAAGESVIWALALHSLHAFTVVPAPEAKTWSLNVGETLPIWNEFDRLIGVRCERGLIQIGHDGSVFPLEPWSESEQWVSGLPWRDPTDGRRIAWIDHHRRLSYGERCVEVIERKAGAVSASFTFDNEVLSARTFDRELAIATSRAVYRGDLGDA
jgi:hypothetical protein